MFLTDSHCHLNKEYFPDGLGRVFERAEAAGVRRMIFASSDVATSREAAAAAAAHTFGPEIFALAGVHPHEAAAVSPAYLDDLRDIAKEPRVVAVGEIGLDYFYEISPREVQRRVLCEQLELAREIGLPVVIHVRDAKNRRNGDAGGELAAILREHDAGKIGGVIHCFSGEAADAEAALELGFYISFAGPVTYPKNTALREAAAVVPLDRILCETDSPYLAPQGFRGKPNEPCHVREVYEYVSMLKCVSMEEFSAAVDKNAKKLFRLEARDVRI